MGEKSLVNLALKTVPKSGKRRPALTWEPYQISFSSYVQVAANST